MPLPSCSHFALTKIICTFAHDEKGGWGCGHLAEINQKGRTPQHVKIMGKLTGAVKYVGKMNDTVGFKNSLAKDPNSTFVRAKAVSVKNPKSYKQATQRAKTRPASLFYAAFEPVLNHAFIPKGGATRNRLRFLALAMRLCVPFVFKGENKIPFNVPYVVSEGSLGLGALTKIKNPNIQSTTLGYGIACTNIYGATAWDDDPTTINDLTVSAFSTAILAANPNLSEGMEITIIAVEVDEDDLGQTIPARVSIVLDTNDTITTMANLLAGSGLILVADTDHRLCAYAVRSAANYSIPAGAIIISSRNGSTWNYTTSELQMNSWGIDGFDWDEESIIESYMDSANSVTSDRILQQANNNIIEGVRPVSGSNLAYTVSPAVAGATYNFSTAAVVVMSDGTRRVVISSNGTLMHADGVGGFDPIQQTVDEETSSVGISNTTWSRNNTITEQEAAGVPFGA